jgi:hypothetical protein
MACLLLGYKLFINIPGQLYMTGGQRERYHFKLQLILKNDNLMTLSLLIVILHRPTQEAEF